MNKGPNGRGGTKLGDIRKPFPKRFWDKVQESDGCWLWKAATAANGYGKFSTRTAQYEVAHRVSWMLLRGDPGAMCVLHRCDVRNCVNPDHLFLGTYQDNNRDMAAKGRHWAQKKTHCKNGHAFTPENTFRQAAGGRGCIACRRARWHAKGKPERAARRALERLLA